MRQIKKISVMAIRNLIRNRRRTVSTLAAIAIGLASLMLMEGFISFTLDNLGEQAIHSGTGHLQIALNQSFFDEGDSDPFPYMLEDYQQLVTELGEMPEVMDVVPTVSFFSVLASEWLTGTVMVTAMPLERSNANMKHYITEGTSLIPGTQGKILAGTGVAADLCLTPNESVYLYAQNKAGGLNTDAYIVSGVTSTPMSDINDTRVFMELEDAAMLIGSDLVPVLIVFLKNTGSTAAFISKLKKQGSTFSGYCIRSYRDLSAFYHDAETTLNLILMVTGFIVLVITLFSIWGTLSLAAMERRAEIGTLRAFGIRRTGIAAMFLIEGIMFGAAGIFIGFILGEGIAFLVNAAGGIALRSAPNVSMTVSIMFTPELSGVLRNGIFVLCAAVAGAVVPGVLSSRKMITELLRAR